MLWRVPVPHYTILFYGTPPLLLWTSPRISKIRYRGKLSRGIGENPKEVTGIPLEGFPRYLFSPSAWHLTKDALPPLEEKPSPVDLPEIVPSQSRKRLPRTNIQRKSRITLPFLSLGVSSFYLCDSKREISHD